MPDSLQNYDLDSLLLIVLIMYLNQDIKTGGKMKKVKILMLFAFVCLGLFSQENDTKETESIRMYRINPIANNKSKKFPISESHYYNDDSEERLGDFPYQLSVKQLSEYTSEELLILCLDHPLLRWRKQNYFAQVLFFNGLQELINRQDFLDTFKKTIVQYLTEVIDYKRKLEMGFRMKNELKEYHFFSVGLVFFLSDSFYINLDEDLKIKYKNTLSQIAEELKNTTKGYYYFPFLSRDLDNVIQIWLLSEYNKTPVKFVFYDKLPYWRYDDIQFSRIFNKDCKFLFPTMKCIERTKDEITNLPYQLPQDLLPQLSTIELFYYTIEHPCLQLRLNENYIKNFNGFQELLYRVDFWEKATLFLLNEYPIIDRNTQQFFIGQRKLTKRIVEFLFSKTFWNVLNNSQKIEHLKIVIEHYPKFSFFLYHFFNHAFPEDVVTWGRFCPTCSSAHLSAIPEDRDELSPAEVEQQRIEKEKETKERMEKQIKYLHELINRLKLDNNNNK
jgi:hypothetical protein